LHLCNQDGGYHNHHCANNQFDDGYQKDHREENRLFSLYKSVAFFQVHSDNLEHADFTRTFFMWDMNKNFHNSGERKTRRAQKQNRVNAPKVKKKTANHSTKNTG